MKGDPFDEDLFFCLEVTSHIIVHFHCNNWYGCKFPNGHSTTWDDIPQEIEGLVTSDLAGGDE